MAPVIIKPRELQVEASTEGSAQLLARKRKKDEDEGSEAMNGSNNCIPTTTSAPPTKTAKTENNTPMEKKQQESVILKTYSGSTASSAANKKARETRLEQNRKAARESRRRKKVMIEDLQRSVIFFSRANGALKHQNDELTRLFMQAQAQVSVIESTMNNAPISASTTPATTVVNGQHQQTLTTFDNESPAAQSSSNEAKKAPAPATSATPLPPPATTQTYPHVPVMQPGATMQAMASFQQAAAAAMQVAVQGMQGITPGASLTSLAQPAPTTASASAQQAYNDTMTALAMQQAAIAAAAVPPHLMAQIVGSYPTAPTAPTLIAAPATILPATTTPIAAPASGSTTSSRAEVAPAPVPVAPMPSPVAIATQGAGES